MPTDLKAKFIFPAKGEKQLCAGQNNGTWMTWMRIDGEDQRPQYHNNSIDAMKVYDALVDLYKTHGVF